MPDPWYRTWRHEERAYLDHLAQSARFRKREAVKRALGELCIIGAVVAFAWSWMPA